MNLNNKYNDIKINIGCGQIAADGWFNLDKSPNALLAKHKIIRKIIKKLSIVPASVFEANYRSDIKIVDVHKRGLPVPDNSTSWIYCSHVIGHMSRDQALNLANECLRALKPGGRLRIVTPNLRDVAVSWLEKIDAYLKKNRDYFLKYDEPDIGIGDCFVKSINLNLYNRANLSRIQRLFDYPLQHYYDLDSLTLLLKIAGFSDVKESCFRITSMPDIEYLEKNAESLYVEAIK
ncbi:MAG: methyltransferase domain-containing protein [Candidatus Marinimicrobia bacterium]|nr:methyltransferase domain-containing protein [Candidatus Neomarinimicrobiota bacterium]